MKQASKPEAQVIAMSSSQVTAYLGISTSTLHRYIRLGHIVARQNSINNRLTFDQRDVEALKRLLQGEVIDPTKKDASKRKAAKPTTTTAKPTTTAATKTTGKRGRPSRKPAATDTASLSDGSSQAASTDQSTQSTDQSTERPEQSTE